MTRAVMSRAERRDRTIADLVAAADMLFVSQGFHGTTVDQIAAAAGYTKGAVYSNFAAKEDLFFAVYERRASAHAAGVERSVERLGSEAALNRLARDTTSRRGRDDGWLAVYFEFWAHVLRHPELRERFAAVRARSRRPLVAALERFASDRGSTLPFDATQATIAMNAAQVGIALERLTSPELVDAGLGERVSALALETLEEHLR